MTAALMPVILQRHEPDGPMGAYDLLSFPERYNTRQLLHERLCARRRAPMARYTRAPSVPANASTLPGHYGGLASRRVKPYDTISAQFGGLRGNRFVPRVRNVLKALIMSRRLHPLSLGRGIRTLVR